MKRFDRQYKIKKHTKVYRKNPFIKYSPITLIIAAVAIVLLIGVGWGIAKAVNKALSGEVPQEASTSDAPGGEAAQTQGENTPIVVPEYDDRKDSFYTISLSRALNNSQLDKAVEEAKKEDVKYLYIKLKETDGEISFNSNVEAARTNQSIAKKTVDIATLKEKLKDSNVKLAVDVAAFKDSIMAKWDKESAVLYQGSKDPWLSDDGRAWLDPTNPKAKEYILNLIDDLYTQGADCVILSNVQFPKGNKEAEKDTYYEVGADNNPADPLNRFILEAEQKALEKGKSLFVKIDGTDLFHDTDIYGGNPLDLDADNIIVYLDIKPSAGDLQLDKKISTANMNQGDIDKAINDAINQKNTSGKDLILLPEVKE